MKPNCIVIGAMKAGTTSLHHYLDAHPNITMTQPKEVHYFSRYYEDHDDEWYLSHFADMETPVCGETSPSYTRYPGLPSVPKRMYRLLPEVSLIYVVRDPIDRIISHFNHAVLGENEKREVNEALQHTPQSYMSPSKYYMQLQQYLEYYDFANTKVIVSENLRNDTRETVQNVYRFLGMEEEVGKKIFNKQMYQTSNRKRKSLIDKFILNTLNGRAWLKPLLPQFIIDSYQTMTGNQEKLITRDNLTPKTLDVLKDALSDDVQKLRKLTDRDFAHWDI